MNLFILIPCAYRFSGLSVSIDKYIICCFSQRASMLSNIHCTLGARINAPRLVNAK